MTRKLDQITFSLPVVGWHLDWSFYTYLTIDYCFSDNLTMGLIQQDRKLLGLVAKCPWAHHALSRHEAVTRAKPRFKNESFRVNAVFRKLNLKHHVEILVLNAPASFEVELASLEDVIIRRDISDIDDITFSLVIVKDQASIHALAPVIAGKAKGDAIMWFSYPKASSKRYTCDFNRDTGFDVLGSLGFQGVRQIAIDEDWSALRFRRVEYIHKLARDTGRRT